MLTFNNILQIEGIDVSRVRLVRHQDTRWGGSASPYSLWRAHDGRFETYQNLQRKERFALDDILASFVVTPAPRSATLFVGLYRVVSAGHAPEGMIDPLGQHDVTGYFHYDVRPEPRLNEYAGRLVIEWGEAKRVWVQRAANNNKPVVEIRDQQDPPFPGFARFRCAINDFPGLYPSWLDLFRNIKGVYLLVDPASGKQYVGSAKGEQSLYGRLAGYANGGHGGNVELKALGPRNFQVSVLEIVGLSTADQTIEAIESGWKDKLLSRQFGLNRN